jgi:hypothetical protein
MMPVLWQVTDLSTQDAAGNYQDDLVAGRDEIVGFRFDLAEPGGTPVVVVVVAAAARLYRYRKPHEITGPTIAKRVLIMDGDSTPTGELDVEVSTPNVNITIPADTMEIDQSYQMVVDATDDVGATWTRTREYRAVAG